MDQRKRILICPLNWGLGHATRCIPIIRLLLQKNAEVIIAADGRPLELLKQEFPELQFIIFKGYDIQYPDKGSMILKMLISIPRILKGIKAEHETLKKIIVEKKIDVVISDNRFGLWNKEVKSIFITHQLMIKAPVAEKLLHRIHLNYIKKYDECWVPDVEGTVNFSGDLAHKYPLPENAFFIGILSRFRRKVILFQENQPAKYDVMAIVSGPEPQRTLFENLVISRLTQTGLKAIVVLGKTETNNKNDLNKNIVLVDHMGTEDMQTAILNSKIIIARSGYSTIMDLAILDKKVIFIPTPGQTEQEYLAKLMIQQQIAFSQTQEEFNLIGALKEAGQYKGFEAALANNKLEERINYLLTGK